MNFLRRLFGGSSEKTPEPKPVSLNLKVPPSTFSGPQSRAKPIVTSGRGTVTLAPAEGDNPHEIVGESYYQDALASIAGPKSPEGADEWITAELVPEPHNPYDSNAVAVLINGKKVGHLSREDAPILCRSLRSAGAERAECDGTIEGGWKNARSEGSYCVRLDIDWPPRVAD